MAKRALRLAAACALALAPLAWTLAPSPPPTVAEARTLSSAPQVVVTYPYAFSVTPPLRDLTAYQPGAPSGPAGLPATEANRRFFRRHAPEHGPEDARPDAALASPGAVAAPMPAPIANFEGVGNLDAVYPADPNGDIGYDPASGKKYYFQWVNLHLKVWDVTTPAAPIVEVPATAGNALWASALPGTPCALHNNGDPIALFDEQARRWFISQFVIVGAFHQCVAVSQTADPGGAWFVYDYQYLDGATYFNDYPKFGVWPDPLYGAYYMSVNQFNASGVAPLGAGVAAFDRSAMLAGSPGAVLLVINLHDVEPLFDNLLPADLDGAAPLAGTPGFFFAVDDNTYKPGLGIDAMRIWEFRPNWSTPASTTVGIGGMPNFTLPVASFSVLPCTLAFSTLCVPQPDTGVKLDGLADRLMYRAALRNFGDHQSLVVNHTVHADGTDRAGVRWYELRRDPGTGAWSLYQQSTHAPADGTYRWMASAAMDRLGNMALGYSAGSSTLYPSIRYAGRLVTDTLNMLPQGEMTMTAGTGSQTGPAGRWGDYSMLGVDPQDGCTFWYTNEYVQTTGFSSWRTRIAAFKFPSCTPANGNLYLPLIVR